MVTKIIAIVVTGVFINFIPPHRKKELIIPPPNELIVKGTVDKWQNLMDCLNKSKEEHIKVAEAINFLWNQLNDTTLQKKLTEKLK